MELSSGRQTGDQTEPLEREWPGAVTAGPTLLRFCFISSSSVENNEFPEAEGTARG